MMKSELKITNIFMFLLLLLFIFIESNAQVKGAGCYNPQKGDLNSISLEKTFTKSITFSPFKTIDKVYGIDLSADITLNHYVSLVRVILVDDKAGEYMIYEAYPRITGTKSLSIENICEETYLLNGKKPALIKLEIIDGSITINKFNIATTEPKLSAEDYKRLNEEVRISCIDNKILALNSYIKANGMDWKAEKTSISHKPFEEKKMLINGDHILNWQGFEYHTEGVFEVWDENGPYNPAEYEGSKELRKEWDWRNRHGANEANSPYYDGDKLGGGWLTAIKDQSKPRECNHCWAFSPTATLEGLTNIYFNQHIDLDLSEQDAASCSYGNIGTCRGGYQSKSTNYISRSGLVDEDCFKYTSSESNCNNICNNPKERIVPSGRQNISNNSNNDRFKKALMQYGPIASGVKSMWHYMCLIGFKVRNNKTIWLFKDSYGLGSGKNGFREIDVGNSYLYDTYYFKGPYTSLNSREVKCVDKDKDGFYNWGIGDKPSTCPDGCPDKPDGNDNDPTLGPFDENWIETPVTFTREAFKRAAKNFFKVFPGVNKKTYLVEINSKNANPDNVRIELVNVRGQIIYKKRAVKKLNIIKVNGFAKGVYHIRVISKNIDYIHKILVD